MYQKVIERDDAHFLIHAQLSTDNKAEFGIQRLHWPSVTVGKGVSDRCYERGVADVLRAAQAIIDGQEPHEIDPFG
jgi:hypothetical protein